MMFTVEVNHNGTTATTKYRVKNIATDFEMWRLDISSGMQPGQATYIVNEAVHEAWIYDNAHWNDVSDFYTLWFDYCNGLFAPIKNQLAGNGTIPGGWDGTPGTGFTYTDGNGDLVTVSNIVVNPVLDDALFLPS
jgi:hypothetical protein